MLQNDILKELTIIDDRIIKVDHLINHQINTIVLQQIAKSIADYYKHQQISKILTVETGGVALAVLISLEMNNIDVVYAKKTKAVTQSDNCYEADLYSFTKQTDFTIRVDQEFLSSNDRILIVDDFLASGSAINALVDICNQAESTIVGAGFIFNKIFQNQFYFDFEVYAILNISNIINGKVILED